MTNSWFPKSDWFRSHKFFLMSFVVGPVYSFLFIVTGLIDYTDWDFMSLIEKLRYVIVLPALGLPWGIGYLMTVDEYSEPFRFDLFCGFLLIGSVFNLVCGMLLHATYEIIDALL